MALRLLSYGSVPPLPVAIVLNSFDPGGTERQMTELICRLDRTRFDVQVACLSSRGSLRDRVAATAPITEFAVRGLLSASAAREGLRFTRWCRRRRIHIVHACDFYANVFALPAAALARVPLRIGSRRDVSIPERTAAQHRLQVLAYRAAHRVVANSGAAVTRLREEGVSPRKLALIENGLDLDTFRAGAAGSTPTITTVAHLRPGKGLDVLLDAVALLAQRIPDVTVRVAGDGTLRKALETQRQRLGLTDRVQLLGHTPDIPSLLRNGGVFAFPSLMEASPNAVIEAMAAGLPIVATRVGGIPEVVVHEQNGLLVEPGNPAVLADALQRLLLDPGLAARLGLAARATVEARFSFERMVRAFEALYTAAPSASPAQRDGVPHLVEQLESKVVQ